MKALRSFLIVLILISGIWSVAIAQDSDPDSNAQMESTEPEESSDLSGFGEEGSELSGFEEGDGGFQTVDIDLDEIDTEPVEDSLFMLGGFVEEEIDYSHAYEEDPDFSKIRTTLNLKLDIDINDDWKGQLNWNGFYDYSYAYRGRDEFTDETLETYESESEFRDVYLDGILTDWLRIKIGRQIIAWGQSETAQITDVANPRDLRELGMVDLEDSRVQVAATKMVFSFGTLALDAVAIHEIRGNKMPAEGSEFDVYQDIRAMGIELEEEEIPESTGENTEYLVRLFKAFNGGDVGIMWADTYDDYPYLDFYSLDVVNMTPVLTLVPRHKRIQTVGFSANLVSGSWLFKTEVAKKSNMAFARSDIEDQVTTAVGTLAAVGGTSASYDEDSEIIKPWIEKDMLTGMLGVEYSGISDLTISLEAVGERIEDYEEAVGSDETSGQYVLLLNYEALNDTFDAQLFWIRFSDDNGDVVRLNLAYDIIDALNISGGMIAYEAEEEDATVYNYRNNDRVFIAMKYSF